MLNSWYSVTLLAFESSAVMGLRLMALSGGGQAAQIESQLMVTEKIAAGMEAAATLMSGGTPDMVIHRYREQVAANAERLMVATFAPFAGCAAPALKAG